MFVVGRYPLTIDGKSRLSIPQPVRNKQNPELEGKAYYAVPGRRRHVVALFAERDFEKARKGFPAADHLSDDAYAYRQFESAQTVLLEPDAQGRVVFPQGYLERAGIGKDVVLVGMYEYLELWNRKDLEAFESGEWPVYTERRSKAIYEMTAIAGAPAVGAASV